MIFNIVFKTYNFCNIYIVVAQGFRRPKANKKNKAFFKLIK